MVKDRNVEIRNDDGKLLNPTVHEVLMAWGADYTIRHLGDKEADKVILQASDMIAELANDTAVRDFIKLKGKSDANR